MILAVAVRYRAEAILITVHGQLGRRRLIMILAHMALLFWTAMIPKFMKKAITLNWPELRIQLLPDIAWSNRQMGVLLRLLVKRQQEQHSLIQATGGTR